MASSQREYKWLRIKTSRNHRIKELSRSQWCSKTEETWHMLELQAQVMKHHPYYWRGPFQAKDICLCKWRLNQKSPKWFKLSKYHTMGSSTAVKVVVVDFQPCWVGNQFRFSDESHYTIPPRIREEPSSKWQRNRHKFCSIISLVLKRRRSIRWVKAQNTQNLFRYCKPLLTLNSSSKTTLMRNVPRSYSETVWIRKNNHQIRLAIESMVLTRLAKKTTQTWLLI